MCVLSETLHNHFFMTTIGLNFNVRHLVRQKNVRPISNFIRQEGDGASDTPRSHYHY